MIVFLMMGPDLTIADFFERLPANEKLVVDVLRQLILEQLPAGYKEKLAYQVPYYYLNRRVCLLWPASIKGGGVKAGVLLGFCYGNLLEDPEQYLQHGSNKQVFYRIYESVETINILSIQRLLTAAVLLDKRWKK